MQEKNEVFIIAEIGANHNGDIQLAKKNILSAKECGCSAVKFQSWDEKLFSDNFYLKNPNLLKQVLKYKISFNQMLKLRNFAKKNRIKFGTAVFNKKQLFEAVKINCDFIKIASMDINNLYLLNLASKIKNPLIISTGTATKNEIIKASKIFHQSKKKNVTFLHCITLYPPKKLEKINLNNIYTLKKITKYNVGYSDHTTIKEVPIAAAILGSKVIEKHFTLNKKLKGWDHSISADPKEMKELVRSIKLSKTVLGSFSRSISKEEKQMSKIMRRGIYTLKNIKKGEKFSENNIILQRPETNLNAEKYLKILNQKSKNNLFKNFKLRKKDIS